MFEPSASTLLTINSTTERLLNEFRFSTILKLSKTGL